MKVQKANSKSRDIIQTKNNLRMRLAACITLYCIAQKYCSYANSRLPVISSCIKEHKINHRR